MVPPVFPFLNFFFGVGLSVGWLYLEKRKGITVGLPILAIIIMLSFIGGTLLNWYLFPDLLALPIITRIRQSGLTAYGTIISFYILLTLYLVIGKHKIIQNLGEIVCTTVLAHGFGRIGCFFAGCCYGKVWDHENEHIFSLHRIPTQLIESVFLFILFFLIHNQKNHYRKILIYFFGYPFFRFFIEFIRDDERGYLLFNSLSVSQELSIYIVFMSLVLLYFYKNKSEQKEENVLIWKP